MIHSARVALVVAVGVVSLGCQRSVKLSTVPPSQEGTAAAGGAKLVVDPMIVQPGQQATLTVIGMDMTGFVGGVANEFQVMRDGTWGVAYVLFVGRSGELPVSSPAATPGLGIPAVGLRGPGPFSVVIPEVPGGTYRIRRDLVADRSGAALERTITLYSSVKVVR